VDICTYPGLFSGSLLRKSGLDTALEIKLKISWAWSIGDPHVIQYLNAFEFYWPNLDLS
jgi:hypothetical protein